MCKLKNISNLLYSIYEQKLLSNLKNKKIIAIKIERDFNKIKKQKPISIKKMLLE